MDQKLFPFAATTTQYWEYGDNNQPTIIMIHGFRGTHHGLQRIIDHLADFHIIVPDLPGFGDSEPFTEAEHSVGNYVKWLEAFIVHLALPRQPILLGHSFGSIITSHYTATHATSISKLILINPIGAPALEGPKAVLTKLAIFYYWLGRKLPERASHLWLSNPSIVKVMSLSMTKSKDKDMLAYVHDQHLTYFSRFANPQVVAEAFNASVSHDVREVASHITSPTLLIAGDVDDITPIVKQQELAEAVTGSQLVVLKNVGHLIHYETADQAAEAIRKFI